jgi:hypothetical protein
MSVYIIKSVHDKLVSKLTDETIANMCMGKMSCMRYQDLWGECFSWITLDEPALSFFRKMYFKKEKETYTRINPLLIN